MKLKPCPFCGSFEVEVKGVGEDAMDSAVVCQNCGAVGPLDRHGDGNAENLWNERQEKKARTE